MSVLLVLKISAQYQHLKCYVSGKLVANGYNPGQKKEHTFAQPHHRPTDSPTARPTGRLLFSETLFFSSYLGQADSSYMGQEVKISDLVRKIISLVDNNNIASLFAFVCGEWRPKADYLGGVGGRSPRTDIPKDLGGGSPPA